MCGSDTVGNQSLRNEESVETEKPETVFGLHDALISSRELEDQLVACKACVSRSRVL